MCATCTFICPYVCPLSCTYTTGRFAQILVRAHKQFELFMGQQQFRVDHQVFMVVLKTLAKIGPTADPVFRDECEETEI